MAAPAAEGKATPQGRQPQRTPKGLTARQKKILETIQRSVNDNGYPPSMREIGDTVGLAVAESVKDLGQAIPRVPAASCAQPGI